MYHISNCNIAFKLVTPVSPSDLQVLIWMFANLILKGSFCEGSVVCILNILYY